MAFQSPTLAPKLPVDQRLKRNERKVKGPKAPKKVSPLLTAILTKQNTP